MTTAIFLLLIWIIDAPIAIYIYNIIKRIPEQHRKVDPYFALLVLIPFVGIVFLWIVVFGIHSSFLNCFSYTRENEEDIDSCRKYGLVYVILVTLGLIPGINYVARIPTIIFLILYLVKLGKIDRQLPEAVRIYNVNNKSDKSNESNRSDKYELLERLKKLLDAGAVTKEEFDTEKQKIMIDT